MQERTREESYWPALDGSAVSWYRKTILVKRDQYAMPHTAAMDSLRWHPATVHMLSSRPGTIQLQFESLRSAPCIPRLPSKSTDHVHHRPCADGTVRHPYPSELTCRGGYLEHLR